MKNQKVRTMVNTKVCSKCGIEKPLSDFWKDKKSKDGHRPDCKECRDIEKHRKDNEKYRIINREKINQKQKEHRKTYPENAIYNGIKQRCTNPKASGYEFYGGRGIECRITEEEIKELMIRDGYWDMKDPTIDRVDNDGHYELSNCRFIERIENIKRQEITKKELSILQYDLQDNFIREWDSATKASKKLKISRTNIVNVLKKRRNSAGNFIWVYNDK